MPLLLLRVCARSWSLSLCLCGADVRPAQRKITHQQPAPALDKEVSMVYIMMLAANKPDSSARDRCFFLCVLFCICFLSSGGCWRAGCALPRTCGTSSPPRASLRTLSRMRRIPFPLCVRRRFAGSDFFVLFILFLRIFFWKNRCRGRAQSTRCASFRTRRTPAWSPSPYLDGVSRSPSLSFLFA